LDVNAATVKGRWSRQNTEIIHNSNGDGQLAFVGPLPSRFDLVVQAESQKVTPSTCLAFYLEIEGVP